MEATLEEVRFLADSANRVEALRALHDGPCDREALQAATGASAPTVGRVLGDFEERGWVDREGHDYVLTKLGVYVADHLATFLDRLGTELRLRDVWPWLPGQLDGFTLELVADATVTVVGPGDPYGPANRCAELYRETDRLRGFDAALTAPHHFEELYGQIVDGMKTELVLPPAVSANIAATYPERADEVVASDAFALWVHDGLPLYRLLVFDDRVGVGGYDPSSGVLQVYVDTADQGAREWAAATFEAFRRSATRVTAERPSAEPGE